jgi:hypothetical protein
MMDFQREPDPKDKTKCDRCHEDVPANPKLTSESEPYCSHCGFVFGTSVRPSVWVCDECGEIILHHGGDDRPICDDCGETMSCLSAQPSRIHRLGVDAELDLGLALLCDAQEGDLILGSDILKDMM